MDELDSRDARLIRIENRLKAIEEKMNPKSAPVPWNHDEYVRHHWMYVPITVDGREVDALRGVPYKGKYVLLGLVDDRPYTFNKDGELIGGNALCGLNIILMRKSDQALRELTTGLNKA